MDADDWVGAFDIFRSGGGVLTVEVLVCTSEDGVFAIDELAEVRGEFLIGGIA